MNEWVGIVSIVAIVNLILVVRLSLQVRQLELALVRQPAKQNIANESGVFRTNDAVVASSNHTDKTAFDSRTINDTELLAKLRSLSPYNFEIYVMDLFRKMGYDAKTTSYQGDGGIDIILKKGDQAGFVQCKKYINKQVGVAEMRDFYGAIIDHLPISTAYFVTTNIFTEEARKFAKTRQYADDIKLIDAQRLVHIVRLLERKGQLVDLPKETDFSKLKSCPKCHAGHLVKRLNKKSGSRFLGCSNYPTCTYAQPLSVS